MAKVFKVKKCEQETNGRHSITALADDGDELVLRSYDKGDIEVGHDIDVELDNLSTYEKPSQHDGSESIQSEVADANASS